MQRSIRNKRRSRQPKKRAAPPDVVERLYVGGMLVWARSLNKSILDAIAASHEPAAVALNQVLTGQRTDAFSDWFVLVTGVGARLLASVRRLFSGDEAKPNVTRVSQAADRHVRQQTKKVLGTKRAEQVLPTEPTLDLWRRENLALIKGLTEQQLGSVERILDQLGNARVEDVASALLKELKTTESRAKLIAVDQTLKLNAQLTKDAHRQAGIDEYYWADVNDESVRDRHRELGDASRAGKRFRYDDPPVVNEHGDTGNPGDDYRCRCQAIPYVPELDNPEGEDGQQEGQSEDF